MMPIFTLLELQLLRENLHLWRMTRNYVSNWRELHIDGFEGSGHDLPCRAGKMIQFFNYANPVPANETAVTA